VEDADEKHSNEANDAPVRFGAKNSHTRSFPRKAGFRKPRTFRRAFALVEATMALSLLSITGLFLLKLSLNVVYPRQYALQQILTHI
jgi:hypothetical protein